MGGRGGAEGRRRVCREGAVLTLCPSPSQGELPAAEVTSLDEMDRLCKYIFVRDNTDRLRTRAVLCHIYHMSLHDKWYEARDLMLMAHLQVRRNSAAHLPPGEGMPAAITSLPSSFSFSSAISIQL